MRVDRVVPFRWMKTLRWAAGVAVVALATSAGTQVSASNAPKVIYLMRHAEKPIINDKDPNLAPEGFKRAQALPSLFVAMPGRSTLPPLLRPDAIFATAPAKHSNRPVETVTPLSMLLHERIDQDYEDIEAAPLAKQIFSGKYAGKVVVVCWHHGEIPHVAKALGVEDAPKKWDPSVFDQIWKIEYSDGHAHMSIVNEHLLQGDAP